MPTENPAGFIPLPWCVDRPEPIGWGIVGPGTIAGVFARALQKSGAGTVARVHGRSRERGEAFCAEHGGRFAESMEELLADEAVRAVYVATPHPMHASAVASALVAGRAVLCEKPMTTSPGETERLIGLSRRHGSPLVEAWMYRTHPQIARVAELIGSGELGRVRRVRSAFGFVNPAGPPGRLLDPALGGGVIYDIGGYPLTLAMLACRKNCGTHWCTPRLVSARGEASERGVDLHAEAEFELCEGVIASLAVSLTRPLGVSGVIECERGTISLPNPFLPEGRRDGRGGEVVIEGGGRTRTERPSSPHCCFALEAIATAQMLARGEIEPGGPMVNHAESRALAAAMEAWRGGVLGGGSGASG